jgi:ATP-dependent DNA helicase RecQ
VVSALADIARWARPAWLTAIPSARQPQLLARIGEQLGAELGVPVLHLLARTRQSPPQREMANAAQQVANVRGAFRLTAPVPPGVGLLLDDRANSGWTLAMVGGQLRKAGATAIVPLVLGALG